MKRHSSFFYLNTTQFLGALNDNIFKFLIIFFLINIQGEEKASSILATAGAVFVLPFLFFSHAAGVLADRISKKKILVAMKMAETLIMIISVIVIHLKIIAFPFVLLFLMASQSAIFGPSKYGIIPEIVKAKDIPKANGLLISFTYLAIIIGTFLAAFLTDITSKNFTVAFISCVLIASAGTLTSLKIEKKKVKKSKKKFSFLFLLEICRILKETMKYENLFLCVFGTSFFLFLGSYVQLNIIPFTIESLQLTEVAGGYLFLATAVGIAIGSLVAGRISKERIELATSPLAGYAMFLLFILLKVFSHSLPFVVLNLILLGIAGGIFLIPFEAYIQLKSPEEKRGQILGSSSFLSFVGVLISSFLLYLINRVLGFSPATGFLIMGLITLCYNLFITYCLSDIVLKYLIKTFSFKEPKKRR